MSEESYREQRSVGEQIRKRPAMYVGDIGAQGAAHLVLELISNSVDQYLQGHATMVSVEIDGDTFIVEDDGVGLCRQKAKEVLSHYHFTATADDHAPHIHLSGHGVGLCPVNFLCSEFSMESFDSAGGWRLSYEAGIHAAESDCSRTRGTRVSGTVDRTIFSAPIPLAIARKKCFEAVHLMPGLKTKVNEEVFHAPGGLLALAEFEAATLPWAFRLDFQNHRFGHNYDGEFLSFSMACLGQTDGDTEVLSWVNGGRTPEHGTHVDGALGALKAVGWKPSVLTISVVMKEPRYAGPVKQQLATAEVKKIVRNELKRALGNKKR